MLLFIIVRCSHASYMHECAPYLLGYLHALDSVLYRNDLMEGCLDQVESAFSEYVARTNGNPLVIDTVG